MVESGIGKYVGGREGVGNNFKEMHNFLLLTHLQLSLAPESGVLGRLAFRFFPNPLTGLSVQKHSKV